MVFMVSSNGNCLKSTCSLMDISCQASGSICPDIRGNGPLILGRSFLESVLQQLAWPLNQCRYGESIGKVACARFVTLWNGGCC